MGLFAAGFRRVWPSAHGALLTTPVIVGLYLVFRYLVAHPAGNALAMGLILAVNVSAALYCGAAALVGPEGHRERLLWGLLSAICATLAAQATYFLAVVLAAGSGPLVPEWPYDALNALTVLFFLAFVGVNTSTERLGWRRVTRVVLDVLTLLVSALALLHAVWTYGPWADLLNGTSVSPLDVSSYLVLGAVVIGSDVGLLWLANGFRRRQWDTTVYSAIGIFGAGVVLWPLWTLHNAGQTSLLGFAVLADVFYMTGYYLLFVAGVQRLEGASEGWRDTALYPAVAPPAWPGLVVSTASTLTMILLAGLFVVADPTSSDGRFYLAAITIVTICQVARTALTTAETAELRDRAITDPTTGAYNMREFDVRVTQMLAASRRFGDRFALFAVDLGKQDRPGGRARGAEYDRRLAEAARRLKDAVPDALVFRQAGDEFLVLTPAEDAAHAAVMAELLLVAVRELPLADGEVPNVSLGYAIAPDDAVERDDLLRKAGGARTWVKHHGGGRALAYDDRVVRAYSVADRIALIDERARRDMTRALAAAADARDPGNALHSRNVAALAVLLCEDLGMDPAHVSDVEVAAMLHDVGKIALPDPVLNDRTLGIRERRRVQEHVELGEHLVAAVGIEGLGRWVRAHHERWDGQGYPDGLVGEQIPVEARIIALADAYDGMTTGKRYGAPMSKGAALQEIDLGLGTRFDPVLGERFIGLIGTTAALGWSDDWPAA